MEEDKKLLSIDLSARLPYNIKCQFTLKYGDNGHKEGIYLATITTFDGKDWLEIEYNDTNGASGKPWLRDWSCSLDDIKPYLRPLSSMTEEEKEDYKDLLYCVKYGVDTATYITLFAVNMLTDWFNAHHFDYRGLIEKGLALEMPKEMYYEY